MQKIASKRITFVDYDLLTIRKKLKISRETLSESIKISEKSIRNYEGEKKFPEKKMHILETFLSNFNKVDNANKRQWYQSSRTIWGDIIRDLRIKHNISSKEIAEKIGVTEMNYRNYETGKAVNIPLDKLITLCKILKTTPNDILNFNDK